MGGSTALCLARRGVKVTLFDAAERPFEGASRWNEGKIHLGHLYAADPSLETARRLLPGGLAFRRITESLIGCSLDGQITPEDDIYLVHRHSVLGADETGRYLRAVTALVRDDSEARHYLADASSARVTALTRRELCADYDSSTVVAGFRVPERSVSTAWVADRFVDALNSTPGIELAMRTPVRGVRRCGLAPDDPLLVDTASDPAGPFASVVNCLWENRLLIDIGMGLPVPAERTHRFRMSAFVRTRVPVSLSSAVLVTGPFGDVKNYNGRNLYLSWYPAGLVAEGVNVGPPRLPALTPGDKGRIAGETIARLGAMISGIAEVEDAAEEIDVRGGWVYASGRGALAQRSSTLHRRDRIGIRRSGSYISVDTGKYSIAPWLAEEIARFLQRSA